MPQLVYFIIFFHPIVLFIEWSCLLINNGSLKLAILFGIGTQIPKLCLFGIYIDFHF
jgi:hypothetical protein